ncbi:MAG: hypothetical protein WC750_06305 [Patescibacteria group bacterium]
MGTQEVVDQGVVLKMNILTPTGYIDIEQAEIGCELVYFDLETGEPKINHLTGKERVTKADWDALREARKDTEDVYGPFDFYIINGDTERRWFKNQNWWVNLHVSHTFDLQVGDTIYDDADNYIIITSIELSPGTDEDSWWCLRVDGDHSYIADGVTLHNASYYARNVTGNWSANTSWDAASSGGAGPAGPPVAGDTVIFDANYTGTLTVDGARACAVISCLAGATGTLAMASGTLTVSAGVALATGFHLTHASATSSTLALTASQTVDSAGLTWANVSLRGTITLANPLVGTGSLDQYSSTATIFVGAHNITFSSWKLYPAAAGRTFTFVSSTTFTISTDIIISGLAVPSTNLTVNASSPSTPFSLIYQGTAENCKVVGVNFTDVDASGSSIPIDNWYGGTLTRCTNIANKTSADLARAADASKILTGQTVGGIAGSAPAGKPEFKRSTI